MNIRQNLFRALELKYEADKQVATARNIENVNTKIPRIRLDDVECIACEG